MRQPLSQLASAAATAVRSPSPPVRSACFRHAFHSGGVAALLLQIREYTASDRALRRGREQMLFSLWGCSPIG
jgi:hypothetical protein